MLLTRAILDSKRLIPDSNVGEDADPEHLEIDTPTQLRFPNSPGSTVSVILRRFDAGYFKLFTRRRVPLRARVQVLFRGELVAGEVMHCYPEGDGFSVAVNFSDLGTLRRELRCPVRLAAVVRIPHSEGSFKARIVDMSNSGLGLHVPIEVSVGTIVAVEFERGTIVGEIRHCNPVTGYFHAGLAIEDFVRPEHDRRSSADTTGCRM